MGDPKTGRPGVAGPRRVRLTDARVDALTPQAREYTVWDVDPRRLGVRVLPSGTRAYVLRIRKDGAQRWVTLGKHGDGWDVERARGRAHELLGFQAKGEDPTRLRAALRGIPSLRRLAVYYLREHGDVYLKPASRDRLRTSLLHVVRHVGKVRVDQLTTEDAAQMHAAMKGTPIAANRALVALHGLMRFAQRKGYRLDNPAKGVRYYRERQRERYLSGDETARLARALSDASGESSFVLAAFKLILLTGCRQGEIFGLRWSEVDLERGVLNLGDTKTGARVVYLNDLAQDVLTELPRVEGNPYVIPGRNRGEHYQGEQKAWERVRAAAGLKDLRLHDLRHNYASVLASGGASLQMIGQLLGHKRVATTARYAHLVDSALRDLTERAASALGAVAAPPARGKVLRHRRRRAAK